MFTEYFFPLQLRSQWKPSSQVTMSKIPFGKISSTSLLYWLHCIMGRQWPNQ